ncbi:DEAD/DEAH box helicase [Hohaiivirga grylli]|uniref:DEAD/DEAH box helicase n=1 Tax=Hohaiivirga grylli TaxID=3133970 RepID=UPI00387E2CBB
MSFAELGLSDKVLKAAESAGYTSPTPIQKQAIPHVLARKDVLGIAQTGTGKTAAFTLPMLTLLESGRARARMPRTLILEPTRELAAQVEENFVKYGSEHKLSVALLIGGVSFGDQDAKIMRGADVLIATPGRLLDHFERGKLLLTGVELFVIDEADRMLDMGFIPDIERIAKLIPFTRQTLFFSATMPPEVQKLADTFLHNPVKVEVARASSTATTITQRLVSTGPEPHQKRATLRDLIRGAKNLQNAIIFCNRKRDVATLHRSLARHNFSAVALHGDMDQRARMQALDQFRNGDVAILVASDVAARGLDIPEVSHVFNYDLPFHAEDYVHRIGRTGRAGRDGAAYSLVARGDEKHLEAIEQLISQKVEWEGKPLSERTEEDDSFSAPDRGKGWKKDGDNRHHNNRQHGKGGQHQKNRGPSHNNNDRHGNNNRHDNANRDDNRQENRHNNNRNDRNNRRHDRYDNEPDIPVVGFGDHVPAFIAGALPAQSTATIIPIGERKPVTPISNPPAKLVEEQEISVTEEKKAKPAARKKSAPKKEAAAEEVMSAKKPARKRTAPAKKAEAETTVEKAEAKPKATKAKAAPKKVKAETDTVAEEPKKTTRTKKAAPKTAEKEPKAKATKAPAKKAPVKRKKTEEAE